MTNVYGNLDAIIKLSGNYVTTTQGSSFSGFMEERHYMYILVDWNGNIIGRFDHLHEGEDRANKLEQNYGNSRIEWAGLKNFYEAYGSNGSGHFYRMLRDEQKYFIYDRFKKLNIDFKALDAAIYYINGKLLKDKTQPIAFNEFKPGHWYGHNAPDTPSIIKDFPGDFAKCKYDYFEIKREYVYEGKDKV